MGLRMTIAGLAGTGKSTGRDAVHNEFKIPKYSSGDVAREIAKKRFPHLLETTALMRLERLASKDSSIDKGIDDGVVAFARSNHHCVIESRLAWYFVPEAVQDGSFNQSDEVLKVLLFCPDNIRYERVADARGISISKARKQTIEREESIADRYPRYYGIDYSELTNPENFDYVINTGHVGQEETAAILIAIYKNRSDFLRKR